jgi:hypothetical protein
MYRTAHTIYFPPSIVNPILTSFLPAIVTLLSLDLVVLVDSWQYISYLLLLTLFSLVL